MRRYSQDSSLAFVEMLHSMVNTKGTSLLVLTEKYPIQELLPYGSVFQALEFLQCIQACSGHNLAGCTQKSKHTTSPVMPNTETSCLLVWQAGTGATA